ncbi:putative short chain oxidoreductase protein [Phaeoacremonium minimum UCRPA7]|uniref:Putative short chain oxidoreductase protein n=1 Tax=Phaeoacremonium minimum (strain UCR-PA7) TaxID=1286976 RepID=R8BUG5_PHAM7|nr:putative short chain oxidoreductase protein [Phaeoacremonium minimum UCRPA7]EOO03028.1 putative short chain oxidoreductase protein [Phaeoacremonium minimum UCRPA7]
MQWFITGCSSGLGLELARAVLDAGQIVIASSRRPDKTPSLVAEIQGRGGQWIALDTAGPDVEKVIAETAAKYGPIDVLVNNAGYGTVGPLETQSTGIMQKMLAANLFGPIRASQTIIPSMRERRAGTIVNVSSGEFWFAHAGIAIYGASKFAVEGVSEALQKEVANFGIRVLLAEPGGMRTSLIDPAKPELFAAMPETYKDTMVDHTLKGLSMLHGNQSLDPKRVAAAIVKEVLDPTLSKDGKPMLRMPLGKESIGGMRSRADEFKETAEVFETRALECDFPE